MEHDFKIDPVRVDRVRAVVVVERVEFSRVILESFQLHFLAQELQKFFKLGTAKSYNRQLVVSQSQSLTRVKWSLARTIAENIVFGGLTALHVDHADLVADDLFELILLRPFVVEQVLHYLFVFDNLQFGGRKVFVFGLQNFDNLLWIGNDFNHLDLVDSNL